MNTLIKSILGLFGKAGLKALINAISSSDLFREFIVDLILSRIGGLRDKYPELYTRIEETAHVLSEIPAILTDENPSNTEQIAGAFTLTQSVKKLEVQFDLIKESASRTTAAAKRAVY